MNLHTMKRVLLWRGFEMACDQISSDMLRENIELRARIAELEAELEVTERLYQERDRLLRAIPPCAQHGAGCVPAAIEWVEAQQRAGVPKAIRLLSDVPPDVQEPTMGGCRSAYRYGWNACREAMLAAGGQDEPDMFWNDGDPEEQFCSIAELVHAAWENGHDIGSEITIQQGIRLPNVTVRLLWTGDEDFGEPDYELVAATQPAQEKPE